MYYITKRAGSKAEDVLITLDYVMDNFPAYQSRKEDKDLENDILFCRLAYGFQPDEYAFFGLEKQSKEEREEWITDIDDSECKMHRMGYGIDRKRMGCSRRKLGNTACSSANCFTKRDEKRNDGSIETGRPRFRSGIGRCVFIGINSE